MSFIKKLRLSKRLSSVLGNKQAQNATQNGAFALTSCQDVLSTSPVGAVAEATVNTTLNDDSHYNANNTTLNTTQTTSGSSKAGGGAKYKSSGSRSLIIYHIDSETEGTLSLTARVRCYM